MYDLLLKGGTVIDPVSGLKGVYRVGIADGKIVDVKEDSHDEDAARVLDLRGKLVIPGIVDAHTHIYDGFRERPGLPPDLVGVQAGVTTLVDAGSAGAHTFGGFPRYIIPLSKTEIYCFLHIIPLGLTARQGVRSYEELDLNETIKVAREYARWILGIKVQLVSSRLGTAGLEVVRMARTAADECGVPLVVHIGDRQRMTDPLTIRQVLPFLQPGDIVAHLFTPNPGGVLDSNGHVVPEAFELLRRGVWLDTAHGSGNFSFDVARRVLDQGLVPHTISTDMTARSRLDPVHSMIEMMTRFLALGFPLEEVVAMSTWKPARAIRKEKVLGSLAPGRQADISVLELVRGQWDVFDNLGVGLRTPQALVPRLTIKRGELLTPEWGPRPWGWEPDGAIAVLGQVA